MRGAGRERARKGPHGHETATETGVAVPLHNACMEVIGAVGCLGEPDTARPFALTVKRQIEMILKERQRLQSAFLKENAIQDVISDFINYVPGVSDLDMLETRARCLGFSPDFLYVPIVFDIHHFRQFTQEQWKRDAAGEGGAETFIQAMKNRILLDIRDVFNHPSDVSIPIQSDKYAIFCSVSPRIRDDREKVYERVNSNSLTFIKRLSERGLSAVIGIGFFFEGVPELSFAYRSAWEAVKLGKTLYRRPGVYDIQDLRLEYLLSSLPRNRQKRFVLDRLSPIELNEGDGHLKATVVAYARNFFNRQSTANELHVHRNTLGYRLDKIERLTGKSLRTFHDFLELYVACLLSDIILLSEDTENPETTQRSRAPDGCQPAKGTPYAFPAQGW